MSSGVRENKPLQNKGILIAVVVVFSSLSFSLGYFVGKIGREEKVEPVSRVAEAPQPVQAEPASEKAVTPDKAADLPTEPQKTEGEKAGTVEKENLSAPARTAEAASETPQERKAEKPLKRTGIADSAEKTKEKVSSEGLSPKSEGVKYTVQLGALKSAAEAKKLKSTFVRKGYKAYISSAQEAGTRRKIYKVRAGEFDQRKDAEVLALKINKSEGLKSFVTPKD